MIPLIHLLLQTIMPGVVEFDASGNIFFVHPIILTCWMCPQANSHIPPHLKSGPINFGNWDIRICPDSKKNLWIATPEGLKP